MNHCSLSRHSLPVSGAILSAALSLSGLASAETLNVNQFEYRAPVTFPGYTAAESLYNFPVLVRLQDSADGFSYASAATDGADLRFALADGTLLASEINVWNPQGESLVWVNIPELASGTTVYLYWGDASASMPASQTDGSVWTSYAGVWHMEESGDTLADATANGLDATRRNTTGRVADGVLGAAHHISTGANGVGVGIPSYDSLALGNSFTFSTWLRYPAGTNPGYDRIASRKNSYGDGNGWEITLRSGNRQRIDHRGANGDAQDSTVFSDIADATWHHLVVTYDGTKSSVFVDGVQKVSEKSINAAATDNGRPLVLGNNANYNEATFKGALDEVRLRDGVADLAWASAEYATVHDASFASVGTAEAMDRDLPVASAPTDVAPALHAVTFTWTLRDAGSSATDVTAELGTASGVYPVTQSLATGATAAQTGSATITGLNCNTTYHLRISATNGSGTRESGAVTFTTGGATTFSGVAIAPIGIDGVDASATVTVSNPNATVSAQLLLGPAGGALAAAETWTPAGTQSLAKQVTGLTFGDYEGRFEAQTTCADCGSVATTSSDTVGVTLVPDFTWTGDGDGSSWAVAGNWDTRLVPVPTANVFFLAGDAAVEAAADAAIETLHVDGNGRVSLDFDGKSLTTAGGITMTGTVSQTTSLAFLNGSYSFGGGLDGVMLGNGTLRIGSDASVTLGGGITMGRGNNSDLQHLRNTIVLEEGAHLTLTSGGISFASAKDGTSSTGHSLRVGKDAVLAAQSLSLHFPNTQAIVDGGTMNVSGTIVVSARGNGAGNVGGVLRVDNGGTVTAGTIQGSYANYGIVQVLNGSTLTCNSFNLGQGTDQGLGGQLVVSNATLSANSIGLPPDNRYRSEVMRVYQDEGETTTVTVAGNVQIAVPGSSNVQNNFNCNNHLELYGGAMTIDGTLSLGNSTRPVDHFGNLIHIERASTRLSAAKFNAGGDCALEFVVPAGGFGRGVPFTVSGTATIAATTRLVIDATEYVTGGGGAVTLFSAGTLADDSIPAENITVTTVEGGTATVLQKDNAIVLRAGPPTTVILFR